MTDLSEVMKLLQKNIDINETVWNSLGSKVYTQVLQWGSYVQDWNTVDVLVLADCVYCMEVSVLTIITVEYKIRKYIGH
jgi:archaellum component FlaF (FlaF/FlaG flagellin family)